MKTTLGHITYFITDAVDEWRHSPSVNLLATLTLAAALFLAGLVLLIFSNLESHLDRWREDLRVQVFLLDEITQEARRRVGETLAASPEVSKVDYVDKAEALRRFGESFGEALAGLPSELGANPLPASFEVYLAPTRSATDAATAVAASLEGFEGVEEIRFDRQWLERLSALLHLARVGGAGMAVLVFAAVVLVMSSVLRLAVYARRDEIEIVQLVGATPSFVRGPFLVAGLAQGLVASLAALGLGEGVRRAVLAYAGPSPAALLDLVLGHSLSVSLWVAVIATGLAVSFAGAYFAVRHSV